MPATAQRRRAASMFSRVTSWPPEQPAANQHKVEMPSQRSRCALGGFSCRRLIILEILSPAGGICLVHLMNAEESDAAIHAPSPFGRGSG